MYKLFLIFLITVIHFGDFLSAQETEDVSIENLRTMSLEDLMNITIVSATKKPDTVLNIPANFKIITRQEIERMGYATLEELIMNMPGFYHIDTYEEFLIGVRGGIGGSVAILVNGIQHHTIRIKPLASTERARLNIPIESIDRVEVIKGPMSVIYGNNAFFGSINIVTNGNNENDNIVSIGNSSNYDADKGYLNNIFYRHEESFYKGHFVANVGWNKSNGISGKYVDMMSLEQYGYIFGVIDSQGLMHKKLDGDLGKETFNLDFSGNFENIDYNFRYSNMEYGIYLFTPSFNTGNLLELTTFHGNLGITKNLSNTFSFKSDFTFSSETYDGTGDFFEPNIYMHQLQTSERLESEAIINYSNNENFELAAGFRHQQILNAHVFRNTDDPNTSINNKNNDIYSNDLFLNGDKEFNNNLKMIAGIRWSRIEPYKVIIRGGEGNSIVKLATQNIFTPRVALMYNIDDNNILKLMYGEATQNNSSYELKKPEKIKTSELNYLGHFSEFSISASIFQNNISNLRRRFVRADTVSGNSFIEIINNNHEWETRGFELLLNSQPIQNLNLEGSFTWQQTKDKVASNSTTGNSPEYLGKFKVSYLFGEFSLGLNLSYVDEMKVDPGQASGETVDDYFLVGANILYKRKDSNWFLKLHTFNLLNAEIRYPANELVDFQRGSFGPGREITMKVGYSF